jgi:hypothetical protein
MPVNIPLYIQYGQIGQFTLANKYANDAAFNGINLVPPYISLLRTIQETVSDQYALNGSSPALEWLANYMVALSGIWPINTTPVATPFIIITQPQSQTVSSGTNVTFIVVVGGGTPAYTYQWYFNNVAIGGATSSSYSISPATGANTGNYKVIITDANGQTLTSNNALLTVTTPIVIGSVWYGDTDPNADLQAHIDNFDYLYTFGLTHNATIFVPLEQAGAENKYYVIRIPSTESDKTIWFNTALNNGTIPDAVWQSLITFGGFDYYYTRVAASFDYNVTLNLS